MRGSVVFAAILPALFACCVAAPAGKGRPADPVVAKQDGGKAAQRDDKPKTSPDPVAAAEQALAKTRAETEKLLESKGCTEAERKLVLQIGYDKKRIAKLSGTKPSLNVGGVLADGDVGIPYYPSANGLTAKMAVSEVQSPTEMVVFGGKLVIDGLPTKGIKAGDKVELRGLFLVDGTQIVHVGKAPAYRLVPIDGKRVESACQLPEIGDFEFAKYKHQEAIANRKRAEYEAAEARRLEVERAAEAARQAAKQPNRENYAKITIGMSLEDVQNIIGPGKELVSGPGILTAQWISKGAPRTVITITFDDGRVHTKAIIGP